MLFGFSHISCRNIKIILLFIFLFNEQTIAQCKDEHSLESDLISEGIHFSQIKIDSLFESKQSISLLTLQKSEIENYKLIFAHNGLEFKTTSEFGKSHDAFAAVNGGFFNMDSGGSSTYFEINDTTIATTRNPKLKWGIRKDLMNGAIVIDKDSTITIQHANSDQFYELSKLEAAVLVTGPLLIMNSELMEFPDVKFVTNRHPRTCMCIDNESITFIAVDGRSRNAQGMSLYELQDYVQDLGCTDVINLDGGGSTTMWIQNRGIVNNPSDKTGERPVSNAILILKK